MPASLSYIHDDTPMGANLIAGGATFRDSAPQARSIHVIGDFNGRQRTDTALLMCNDQGQWRGFISGVKDRESKRPFPANVSSAAPIFRGMKPGT